MTRIMNTSNLMDFSMHDDQENQFMAPPLTQTPVVKNSILKPSNKDNLIQLTTPVHKNLKVKFQTPQTAVKVTPTRYEQIRELDDQENWSERTTVVLKSDHEENMKNAHLILNEIIATVVERCEIEKNEVKVDEKLDNAQSLVEPCNNDLEKGEVEELKIKNESPKLKAKSGSYSIDFENIDEIDPFMTKGGIALSPLVKTTGIDIEDPDILSDIQLEDISLCDNKTVIFGEADATIVENKNNNNDTIIENLGKNDLEKTLIENPPNDKPDDDLNKAKDPLALSYLVKSPSIDSQSMKNNPFAALKENLTLEEGLLNENTQLTLSAEEKVLDIPADQDLFVTKSNVANSPLKEDENPFATKAKVDNSPLREDVNPLATKSNVVNTPTKNDEDPFVTKSKVPNSPSLSGPPVLEEDLVTPKDISCMSTSELKTATSDSLIEENPFVTKTKIAESPNIVTEANLSEDPFTTKSNIINSPLVSNGEDPFVAKSSVCNSPATVENPFDTKSKVCNSPVKGNNKPLNGDPCSQSDMENPFVSRSKVANSPEKVDEENPFVTKSKVVLSPAKNEEDPFATKSKIAASPRNDVDPFATKTKIAASPDKQEDPFATKTKIASSPDKQEDPFATKTKIAASPDKQEDPFATKTKIAASPDKLQDPFATKTKIAASPDEQEDPFATKIKIAASLDKQEDPFATKTKIAASPDKQEDPFATKTKIPNSPSEQKLVSDTSCREQASSKEASVSLSDNQFAIDEDQFKPATDVFNDTAAWDALENFGSAATNASTLNRQSLYVKFDPLVNLPVDDLKRQSIDVRRASMKLERIRELNNAEESFLLLGTPPKSSVRNVSVIPTHPGKSKTPAKTPVASVKDSAKDLLTESPDIFSMDVSRLGKSGEDLKMNMADIIQESDSGIVEVLKYTDADFKRMQQAILMEGQSKLLAKDREMAQLKHQCEEELKRRNEEAKVRSKNFDEMMVIMTEYEKTIDVLINEKEKLKEEKGEEIKKLKQKLEQLSSDEQSIETAFSDLHRRYDKMKTVLQGYKTNEETLKKYTDECTAKVKATEDKLLALKKDAEAKLKKAITDNENIKSEMESETSKLKVALKRKEMEVQGIQNQLEQKMKENTELTNLCDELLAKVK